MVLAALSFANKMFFIVVAVFVVVNAILVGIEERNMMMGVADIGNKMIYSTQQLSDASNEIYEAGQIVNPSNSFFSLITTYWNLISSFLSVLLWIRIVAFLVDSTLKLPAAFNMLVGLIMFVLIQIIVLLLFAEGDRFTIAMKPILCLFHFIRIIPIIIEPFRKLM